jgi:hypothetical protein
MTLRETLQQMKTTSQTRIPAEAAEIMTRTRQQMEDSGVVRMALGVGQKAPIFALKDWQGERYSSQELLGKGPLVLTFYRGSW